MSSEYIEHNSFCLTMKNDTSKQCKHTYSDLGKNDNLSNINIEHLKGHLPFMVGLHGWNENGTAGYEVILI